MESRNALTGSDSDHKIPFTTKNAKNEVNRVKKQEWTNQIEFFLSCISYRMGIIKNLLVFSSF